MHKLCTYLTLAFFLFNFLAACQDNLAGSYRLRLPQRPFNIKQDSLTIKICNIHKFQVKTFPNNKIQFIYRGSTKMRCNNDYSAGYIQLFKSINEYELDGNALTFKIDGQWAARASREKSSTDLDGNWKLEILNIGMQNTAQALQFNGCNANSFSYKISGKNKIQVKFIGKTKRGCVVDNDRIFQKALTSAKTFQLGQVSFKLYDSDKKLCAYTTPYVV